MASKGKGKAGGPEPASASSVMDRLKLLYFDKIKASTFHGYIKHSTHRRTSALAASRGAV
jgi:hypothetical protein